MQIDNLNIKLQFHAIKMRCSGISHKLCYWEAFPDLADSTAFIHGNEERLSDHENVALKMTSISFKHIILIFVPLFWHYTEY
jgi:hypothetical protein